MNNINCFFAFCLQKNHPREYSSLANAWSFFNGGVADWRVDMNTVASYTVPASIVQYHEEKHGDGTPQQYHGLPHQQYARAGTVLVGGSKSNSHDIHTFHQQSGGVAIVHGSTVVDMGVAPSAPPAVFMSSHPHNNSQISYGFAGYDGK